MGKKKKDKQEKNFETEIITKQDELDLLVDIQKTKRKYEELIAQMKSRRAELNEALKEARLILKEIKE